MEWQYKAKNEDGRTITGVLEADNEDSLASTLDTQNLFLIEATPAAKKETGGQGVLIEDHFRPDDASSTWEAGTWTYRAYNPQRKLWEMEGINTNLGAWQPGLMWSDGADRVLTEWYGPMLVRFRYFAIEPDQFLWRADATFDRGLTWIRDYWTMEVHRISR